MRELTVKLGDRELELAATFKASFEVAKRIGDPMLIMREASLEALFLSRGIAYDPKFHFNVQNTSELLHIGLKAAGSKLTLEEVQELVFDAGFLAAKEAASDFLALIIGPKPKETSPDVSGDDAGN